MKGVIYLNQKSKDETEKTEMQFPKESPREEQMPDESATSRIPSQIADTSENQKSDEQQEENEWAESADREIFNPAIFPYLEQYKQGVKIKKKTPDNAIYVDEIATKIAKVYEKVRRVIDWKEENLVRRTSIERILKRRLISEISEITMLPDLKPKEIAGPVTLEIIRTGYFENGKISEDKITAVAKILDKYIYILKNSPYAKENALAIKVKVHFYNWILEIAACEIEETLDYPYKEDALLNFMTETMTQRIKIIPEGALSEEEKYIQTYIAVHKMLFNLDEPVITYHVLKNKYPLFVDNTQIFTEEFTDNIENIWNNIKEELKHPKRGGFQNICEKYDAAFLILSDVLKDVEDNENLEEELAKKENLHKLIEKVYKKRFSTLKKRLFRSAVYSTLSIFVAGAASLFVFEFPIAKLFYGGFSPWAIVADIMIPTALMFILVGIIRPPAEDNLPKVKEEIEKIVYITEEEITYKMKLNKKVKKVQNFIFGVIYLLGGVASLFFIYRIFKIARVPLTSLYIDTVNVAIVVFAAMVIRQKSKELTIKERTSIFEFILDFFSIPLAKMGSWLSSKWKEFNFISVFFSTLVDTPFSTFIELLEGWRDYIKEKRAGI